MDITDRPIKKVLATWEDAIGKVLTGVDIEMPGAFDEYFVLRFGDEAILLRYHGEYRDLLINEPDELDGDYSSDRKARVYFGIESLAEYEAENARRDANRRNVQELADRATYERLKQRFG